MRDVGVSGHLADVELEIVYNSMVNGPDDPLQVDGFMQELRVCPPLESLQLTQ